MSPTSLKVILLSPKSPSHFITTARVAHLFSIFLKVFAKTFVLRRVLEEECHFLKMDLIC